MKDISPAFLMKKKNLLRKNIPLSTIRSNTTFEGFPRYNHSVWSKLIYTKQLIIYVCGCVFNHFNSAKAIVTLTGNGLLIMKDNEKTLGQRSENQENLTCSIDVEGVWTRWLANILYLNYTCMFVFEAM